MKIETSELAVIAVRTTQYPTDNKKEFLLVGRSNVGKSSFINALVNAIYFSLLFQWNKLTPFITPLFHSPILTFSLSSDIIRTRPLISSSQWK